MQRYIGIDVHAASSTLVVVSPAGKRTQTRVVETSGKALIDVVSSIPGERYICLEEGVQSSWLYELLTPLAKQVVVLAAEKKKRGAKNDAVDAFELAERMRKQEFGGRVYKNPRRFAELREMSRVYAMVTQDVVRVQGRIKSVYRGFGIRTSGTSVYKEKDRKTWLRRLPAKARRPTEFLYEQYDALAKLRAEAQKELRRRARKHRVASILETAPGFGPIRVAELLSIVVSPHRFPTRQKFRAYCGLGIRTWTSSDWEQTADGSWVKKKHKKVTRGLNRNFNPRLKDIMKGAAMTVVTSLPNDPHHKDYERLLKNGINPDLAKLTIARKLAELILAMWKREEEYNPANRRTQTAGA
jgi:transposase